MPELCVILSGGEFSVSGEIPADAFVIACDRGYQYAQQLGRRPDLAVGDFDSYRGDIDPSIPVLRFASEKDDTDTMIAVKYAIEHGYRQIWLLCALGGRLDHALGNLQAAAYAVQRGIRTSILSRENEIYLLSGGEMTVEKREGYSLSLLSLTDRCEQVSARGVKYPLDRAVLQNAFPLGVSNEWVQEQACIACGEGVLMVILSRME